MRILQTITRADSIGGAQTHFLELAKHLLREGHEVLAVSGPGELLGRELHAGGVDWRVCDALQKPIRPFADYQTLRFLERTIDEFQPDLVACHSAKAGTLGRIAAQRRGVPCVFTAHGWSFTDGIAEPQRSVYEQVEKTIGRRTGRIICCSESDRQLAIRVGMPAERLRTVHYGVADIAPSVRANPGEEASPLRIIMVARFCEQKDHQTLFRAIRGIENVAIDLIGDGPLMEKTRTMAEQYGVADRVHFHGYRADVAEFLSRAHIYVLASNWEGFPIATLEAMRAGLPVVVAAVGGAAEAVEEGESGHCFPRGDAAALHQRLRALAASAELRRTMGERGRARYEAEFTLDRMCARTAAVYEELTAAAAPLASAR